MKKSILLGAAALAAMTFAGAAAQAGEVTFGGSYMFRMMGYDNNIWVENDSSDPLQVAAYKTAYEATLNAAILNQLSDPIPADAYAAGQYMISKAAQAKVDAANKACLDGKCSNANLVEAYKVAVMSQSAASMFISTGKFSQVLVSPAVYSADGVVTDAVYRYVPTSATSATLAFSELNDNAVTLQQTLAVVANAATPADIIAGNALVNATNGANYNAYKTASDAAKYVKDTLDTSTFAIDSAVAGSSAALVRNDPTTSVIAKKLIDDQAALDTANKAFDPALASPLVYGTPEYAQASARVKAASMAVGADHEALKTAAASLTKQPLKTLTTGPAFRAAVDRYREEQRKAIIANPTLVEPSNNNRARAAGLAAIANMDPAVDDASLWVQRLVMNIDMKATDKSHAHARIRVVDSGVAQGADMGTNSGVTGGTTVTAANATNNGASAQWTVRQLWLETEAWGIGAKVGTMPISLNDNILVNHDDSATGFATVMLSKSFGNMTAVGAMVKVNEGNINGGSSSGSLINDSSADDTDLYVLSLLGKAGAINFQGTLAYLNAQNDSPLATNLAGAQDYYFNPAVNPGSDLNDWWLAFTLNTMVAGIDLTGTFIYENGMSNITRNTTWNGMAAANQLEGGDFLMALRAKGKTGFGGWNAYGFYAGEDFTGISNTNAKFSDTWDAGGPGAQDLMNRVFGAGTGYNNGVTAPTQNVWGLGVGLTANAGGWTINPMLDYAETVETHLTEGTSYLNPSVVIADANVDHAWGGTLKLSTPIQKDTTLTLTGQYVSTSMTDGGRERLCVAAVDCEDNMHQIMADIKMVF